MYMHLLCQVSVHAHEREGEKEGGGEERESAVWRQEKVLWRQEKVLWIGCRGGTEGKTGQKRLEARVGRERDQKVS